MASLDLSSDVVDLTAALVDIESVSGNEREITDAIESALAPVPWLEIWRHGHTLIARTNQGRSERVVIAGHVDTVPINQNLPSRRDAENLYGLGSCDMKGGVAVALKVAAGLSETNRDVTYVFYECEEVEADRNGLYLVSQVVVAVHLSHGIKSSLQTLGLVGRRFSLAARWLGYAVALTVLVGNCAIVLAVWTGFVR